MADLQTMRANVRTDLVIDPNADVWSNDTIDRFLNQFIALAYGWDNLDITETTGNFTLVASTATYDLASELSNYGDLQSLRLDGKTALLEEVVDLNDFEDNRDLTQTGEPRYYYFYGDQTIGLWPVPDGNITTIHARYNRISPTLTASDVPAFDTRWHHVPELYAQWKCFESVPGHEDKAERSRQIYEREVQRMKNDLWNRDVNQRYFVNTNVVAWNSSGDVPLKER